MSEHGKRPRFIRRIEPYGALIYDRATTALIELDPEETRRMLKYDGPFPADVTAPRFVHVEVSNRCPFYRSVCPYCYIPEMGGREMTFEQLCGLQHQLVEMNVPSMNFGGGEPFMRTDLFDLAEHAHQVGIDVAITTNGAYVKDEPRLALFRQVNISVHGGNLKLVEQAATAAKKHTMVGINMIMRRDSLQHLSRVADMCRANDFELLLLAYKPLSGDIDQVIPYLDIRRTAAQLTHDGVRVAADGTSCELNVDSDWFVDIGSNGDVYQCSFHRKSMGNITEKPFAEIWRDRPTDRACQFHSGKKLLGR